MTLPLTKDALKAAYDYLSATPPFNGWNLPDSEDIVFRIVRNPSLRGWYGREDGRHVIAISSRCIGRTDSLIQTMAHEIVHLFQGDTRMETNDEHNAAFNKLAERVCHIHGFDRLLF